VAGIEARGGVRRYRSGGGSHGGWVLGGCGGSKGGSFTTSNDGKEIPILMSHFLKKRLWWVCLEILAEQI